MDYTSLSKLNVAKLKEKCGPCGHIILIIPTLPPAYIRFCSEPHPGISDKVIDSIPIDLANKSGHIQTGAQFSQQRPEESLPENVAPTTKKRPRRNKDIKEPVKKKTKKLKVATVNSSCAPCTEDVTQNTPTPSNNIADELDSTRTNTTVIRERSVSPHSTTSHPIQVDGDRTRHVSPAPFQSTQTQSRKFEPVHPTLSTAPHKPVNIVPNVAIPNGNCPQAPSPSHPSQNNPTTQSHPNQVSVTPSRNPQRYEPKAFKPPTIIRPPCANLPKPVPPLDITSKKTSNFQAPDLCNYFPLISMPPSTARRRQAERMSIVFSGITDYEVLGLCVRVSRAWRYAVYLSATHALRRNFSGTRLDSIFKQIKEPRMTNMWTYLRARRLEVQNRYGTFHRSWLGRFFECEGEVLGLRRGFDPISWKMWTSPNDDRQIAVALRFISTRVVFSLAKRYNEYDQTWANPVDQVVGAEEIAPAEIWKITTSSVGGNLKSFHILYDTGEVIGLAPPCLRQGIIGQHVAENRPHIEVFESEPGGLRADWRAYISSCELGSGSSLQDSIISGNSESYVAGVSAFWLRSLGLEDEVLRTVARKYVLSCVEPNRRVV
ncbi:hypothetical protein RSOLAG1IB_07580 [Rhizoctonia solani AG-1 IB]|uniref:Uncharacterized protein n=1 Tax=Thanatephorus cucumeris (strain AG1-IB / isolate 7/3/14) TaxID=1108050 RepID=A0A0B7FJ19_THACB|nr:hypothetical protein RSOLAG1IB_07580 [Rhizoctonia solani AG-1 IB]